MRGAVTPGSPVRIILWVRIIVTGCQTVTTPEVRWGLGVESAVKVYLVSTADEPLPLLTLFHVGG